MKNIRPCLLMILDGWGIGEDYNGNAVKYAKTPNLDAYIEKYSSVELKCSGESVGLPQGVMGNSEVGHLNIGAGRIVYQDLLRIDKSIEDKSFFDNESFNLVFEKAAEKDGKVHVFGLLSDGRVHSSLDHLYAIMDMASKKGVSTVIHPILDGRDTPPDSGVNYLKILGEKAEKIENIKIGTLCGRFYAMDRDKRWERVEKAYNLYTQGIGEEFDSPLDAINSFYAKDITDEFVEPALLGAKEDVIVNDNDGVIFFNFRADRAREITEAFTGSEFAGFKRDVFPSLSSYVCMTTYDNSFGLDVAFPPVTLKNNIGEVISGEGLKQLRIAETEKYAHVTYFMNGGVEDPYKDEDRVLIPSPREVKTYDEKPEMSAKEVSDTFVEKVSENNYSLMILNFANMDMVGHTGIFDAAVSACENVDKYLKPVVDCVLEMGGSVLITADHGNSEKMKDEKGSPFTAHTTNPVKLVLVDDKEGRRLSGNGKLGDIAPTILNLMGIDIPSEMTGESLLEK